ncbi:cadherin domain-containing protein [Exilibacterium tricleocarpae]|nr:cadherin domain-containing protein [Exilibacterium tricleocarpae]
MNYYLETSAGEASVRYELSSSQALVVQARAGEQYRVVSRHGELPDNVVAVRTDTDLEVRLDNGVHLIIEDYYVVCRNNFCGISLSEEGVPLSANEEAKKLFSGDNTIVYSHGSLEGIVLLDLLGAGFVHEPQDPPTPLALSTVDDTIDGIPQGEGGSISALGMMSLAGSGLGLIAASASSGGDSSAPPSNREAPVFTSGLGEAVVEVSVNEGEMAVYTAEATDADSGILIYSLSGTDAALFNLDANTGELTFIDAPDYENLGSNHPYSITITATDSDGLSASQNVTIGVSNVNESPVFTSGTTATVNENQTGAYTAEVMDPEGETLIYTYSLSGTDATLFTLDANTGELTFKEAPDYENLGSHHPYNIIITAMDSDGLSTTQNVTISVSNVNEGPVFTSGTTATVNENQTATYTAVATDPDGDVLTCSLGGADAALFTLDANTGELTFKEAPDYENLGSHHPYNIIITAMDSDGLSASQDVTISVSNVNEAPVFTSGTTATVNENQTAAYTAVATDPDGDVLIYSPGGADAALFNLDANTGELTFKNAPDYEGLGSHHPYNITITATDNDGLSTSQDVTISVSNVNEAPVFTSGTTATVNEHQTAAYTAEATDVDSGILIYSLSGADAALFTLDANTGELTFKNAPDHENLGSHHPYNITITAMDSDGLSASQDVTISVSNVNEAPVFTSGTTATVNENQTAAYTAEAMDPEGETLSYTYSLSGTDAVLFNIDAKTGEVTFEYAPDYENLGANHPYNITITATDSDDLSTSQDVTISVNNVMNERVELELPDVLLNSDLGFVINGVESGDSSGVFVSHAGDVNGDGFDDLIVGAFLADRNNLNNSGLTYLVYGSADGGTVELSEIENGDNNSLGIAIGGVREGNRVGLSVSAGDVNGDGYADIIFGGDRGYVVYGGNKLSNIDVSDIENAPDGKSDLGFVVSGLGAGWRVSGGGDINGDGFDDVYIGTTGNSDNYMVYGGGGLSNIDLDPYIVSDTTNADHANGIVIHGIEGDPSDSNLGRSKYGHIVGDVNGDGIDDMMFADRGDTSNTPNRSAGYVVYGGNNLSDIEFSDIAAGTGGFVIDIAGSFASVGTISTSPGDIRSAGDFNGDGFDDLIISYMFADTPNGTISGLSYVLFGGSHLSHIDLADVEQGIGGFAIYGARKNDATGRRVSSAGDINGDGLGDLFITGGRDAPNDNVDVPDSLYVVYGNDTGTVDLAAIEQGVGGFVVRPVDKFFFPGFRHDGDVNGDGFDDLLISHDSGGSDNAGTTYVIYGGQNISANVLVGTSAGETLVGSSNGDQIIAGQGDDTLIGNGGADVLSGGAGDDILAIRDTAFVSLDGGNGIDTLRFDAAIALDFTGLSDNRITDVEAIDLRYDGGNSSLTLGLSDVLNLSDSSTSSDTLRIYGSEGDAVILSDRGGRWERSVDGSETDTWVYSLGDDVLASVLVDESVTVTTLF